MLRWDFVTPAPHSHARGAKRVKGPKVLVTVDQPFVFQSVGQEQHRTRASWRHGWVKKTRSCAFGGPSGHVGGALLVVAKMHQGFAFQPHMTERELVGWCSAHAPSTKPSLKTAPMDRCSVMVEFHAVERMGDSVAVVDDVADDSDSRHALTEPIKDG